MLIHIHIHDFRDACKKKIAHILSFRDRGWGGGRQKLNCLENPENERFFYYFKGKNRSFLEVFETKGGGEGGSFAVVSKRQNMRDFYFASIPKRFYKSFEVIVECYIFSTFSRSKFNF